MTREQLALLRRIQEIEFRALEFNLYLNTHPNDSNALEQFNAASRELMTLKRDYESRYEPLLNFGFSMSPRQWRWINEPWPWEIVH